MAVGALTETITVAAEAPAVDVQSATPQLVCRDRQGQQDRARRQVDAAVGGGGSAAIR